MLIVRAGPQSAETAELDCHLDFDCVVLFNLFDLIHSVYHLPIFFQFALLLRSGLCFANILFYFSRIGYKGANVASYIPALVSLPPCVHGLRQSYLKKHRLVVEMQEFDVRAAGCRSDVDRTVSDIVFTVSFSDVVLFFQEKPYPNQFTRPLCTCNFMQLRRMHPFCNCWLVFKPRQVQCFCSRSSTTRINASYFVSKYSTESDPPSGAARNDCESRNIGWAVEGECSHRRPVVLGCRHVSVMHRVCSFCLSTVEI